MQSNYKVLVLDEDPHCRTQMRDFLDATGLFDVRIADSATRALSMLAKSHFQLVIIDVNMPDMDGLQFIGEMSKRNLNAMLAIVSTSSRRLMNSISLVAKEHGLAMIGTFRKPFSNDDLQALLQHLGRNADEIPVKTDGYVSTKHVFDQYMLESGLKEGNIKAWFQPKIALSSGKINGAEALARWDHPEYGFILAGSFLTAIRRYRLQHALLFAMLNDALDAHLMWQRDGHRIPVSINLPVPLLDDPHLPDELYHRVVGRGVDTENVSFELLEDEAISHPVNYYMGTSRLRLKGFGLAQDDFGRGYSSMYNLISTPFTELKIDKSFVSGAADDPSRKTALISSVQLGRQLGLTVTAEGVESQRDLQFLRSIGCDCAQGFLISAAINAADFGMLLVSESGDSYSPPSPTR